MYPENWSSGKVNNGIEISVSQTLLEFLVKMCKIRFSSITAWPSKMLMPVLSFKQFALGCSLYFSKQRWSFWVSVQNMLILLWCELPLVEYNPVDTLCMCVWMIALGTNFSMLQNNETHAKCNFQRVTFILHTPIIMLHHIVLSAL